MSPICVAQDGLAASAENNESRIQRVRFGGNCRQRVADNDARVCSHALRIRQTIDQLIQLVAGVGLHPSLECRKLPFSKHLAQAV